MNALVVTTPALSDIAALRARAVESESTVYGARRAYAAGINGLSDIAWYHDGVTLPKAIAEEKAEYYKALKAIGYSNPSNAWKMVKQYAFEAAKAEGLFGEVAETEGETEGEAGETREARSLTLRMVEELSKLHKAAMKIKDSKPEEYTDKIRAAHGHVITALKAMGVDIGI
tara:strand:- start:1256 stop:1771 length:516 start_codon:yes stop_codon:yes gene_type:complete